MKNRKYQYMIAGGVLALAGFFVWGWLRQRNEKKKAEAMGATTATTPPPATTTNSSTLVRVASK
jgi:hypothetical protein